MPEPRSQTYVTDSTNSQRIAQRNKVRLDLIPLLREINPAAIEHLCRAADNVRQSLPYYRKGVEMIFRERGITADKFPLTQDSTLLHEWLAGKGFNRTQEEEMLASSQEIVPVIGETGPDIAYFDAELLTASIEVRPVREGDSFIPFGMKGRKLVSDYLTDRKVSRIEKSRQFVATCGDDIIWLIGHRSDNRYRVTATTSRILKLAVVKFSTF